METKYKVKIINESIIDAFSDMEAKQIADILCERLSVPSYLGNLTITYSEIEKESSNGNFIEL